ncbi:unnamed protein product [Arctogadus glacialis]
MQGPREDPIMKPMLSSVVFSLVLLLLLLYSNMQSQLTGFITAEMQHVSTSGALSPSGHLHTQTRRVRAPHSSAHHERAKRRGAQRQNTGNSALL